ncbi:MAG: hypothetical protein WBQ78_16890 [Gammaproteobacteria bacterium]
MDCFIIRVYRHITPEHGKPDEIAGLVERVGRQDNGKPFSGYRSLVDVLRREYMADSDNSPDYSELPVSRIQVVHTGKNR